MIVSYFGEGCFKLQNGELSVLVDPVSARLKGNIVLRTLTPANFTFPKANGESFEILSPGEYEIKGIEIIGLQIKELTEKFLKTVYRIKWDEIIFAFLGNVDHFPSDEILEELEETEVLVLFLNNNQFLKIEEIVRLVKKLEPNLVLFGSAEPIKSIQKILEEKIQYQEKFVFKKRDLKEMKEKFVILKKIN